MRVQGPKTAVLFDFSEAFRNGDKEREVYAELSEADARREKGHVVVLLRKSKNCLRDAPKIWQKVVKQILERVSSACLHPTYFRQTCVRIAGGGSRGRHVDA